MSKGIFLVICSRLWVSMFAYWGNECAILWRQKSCVRHWKFKTVRKFLKSNFYLCSFILCKISFNFVPFHLPPDHFLQSFTTYLHLRNPTIFPRRLNLCILHHSLIINLFLQFIRLLSTIFVFNMSLFMPFDILVNGNSYPTN